MFRRQAGWGWFALGWVVTAACWCGAADPSLVGWWTFDEGSGTIAYDSSGQGHDGTLRGGPTWSMGRIDGALDFDGKDDYVEVGSVGVSGAAPRTVVGWVKADTAATAGGTSVFGFVPDGSIEGTYFDVEVDDKGNYVAHIGGYQWTLGPVDTQWHHVGGSYDGAAGAWYLDGEFVDGTEGELGTIDQVRIGGRLSNGRHFAGLIDDVRIYNRVLTEAEIQAVVAGTDLGVATAPDPADGAEDVARDVVLTWAPSDTAVRHNVYLGTEWDDVRSASASDPRGVLVSQGQTGARFDPQGLLALDQKYYWRVDGIATDGSVLKGRTWSFTSESFSYPIEGVVATASHADAGAGAENTVNGSGLNGEDQHSMKTGDMWLATPGVDEALWIQFAFDRVYKLDQMLVWNYNAEFELLLGFGLKNVAVEYSADGTEWTSLGDVELAQATASATYCYNTTVDFEGVAARFVRLHVQSSYGVMGQYGLSEVRFLYIPAQARKPKPADGATDVEIGTVLRWCSGREAASHEVYLGTDPETLALVATPETTSYAPGNLIFGETYYWRVDEVNEAEAVARWEGDLWAFSTEEFAAIDDFERYVDEIDAKGAATIFDVWLDGWVNGSGSIVGYFEAPFTEQSIVYAGEQSMPLSYDNSTSPFYSEAERVFETAQDWTVGEADRLMLYFRGEAANAAETLYVTLEDSAGHAATVRHEDPDAVRTAQWQAWSVALSAFEGVNPARIEKMAIGLGDKTRPSAGGAGIVYIDEVGFGRPGGE